MISRDALFLSRLSERLLAMATARNAVVSLAEYEAWQATRLLAHVAAVVQVRDAATAAGEDAYRGCEDLRGRIAEALERVGL